MLMPPTKLDYCIARFGRKRRYTIRLSSGHSLTSPPGSSNPCQLLPDIPIGPHGIMVMRAWRGVHRQAYRSALKRSAPDSTMLWLDHAYAHARKPHREVARLFAAL